MRFSFKQLEAHFAEPLPAVAEVAEALTKHAFEVDEVAEKDGDWELEVKILPDRASDAKNDLGMARELSAVLNQALKPEYQSSPTVATARAKINFTAKQITDLIGTPLSEAEISAYLKRSRVTVDLPAGRQGDEGSEVLTALIPAERLDLNLPEDLADEVARLHGYDRIPAKQLSAGAGAPAHHPDFILANQLRRLFVERGFNEIYGYTFRPAGAVAVAKPLASDKSWLRGDLVTGMAEYLEKNLTTSLFDDQPVKLFELGSVFPNLEGEEMRLCFGVAYSSPKFNHGQKLIDEMVAVLTAKFGVTKEAVNIMPVGNLMMAEVALSNFKLVEIEDNLPALPTPTINYQPFSVYPRIIRDLALWVGEGVEPETVAKIITAQAGPLLADLPILFDEFAKDGKKSLAFRLVFQSPEKTLTDEEVSQALAPILTTLTTQGWELR
jgi:phenylalanyl-tRNA synthetase beta chain